MSLDPFSWCIMGGLLLKGLVADSQLPHDVRWKGDLPPSRRASRRVYRYF